MKKKILVGFLFVFLPFLKVNAINVGVSFNCEKTILIPSEEIKCTLDGEVNDGSISGFETDFDFDNYISVTKFLKNSSFAGFVEVEDKNISLYTEGEDITGKFNIGTLYITASSNISVTSSFTFSNSKLAVNTIDNVVDQDIIINPVSFRIASNDNLLSDIKINGKSIEGFDLRKNSFELNLNDEKVTITATSENQFAMIDGLVENSVLNYGENKFSISVTSENGSKNVYVLEINRFRAGELEQIILDGKSYYIGSEDYEHEIFLTKDYKSIDIDAKFIDDSLGYFVDGFGPRKIENLVVGDNNVLIKTIDKEGNVLTYTINIVILGYEDDSSIENKEENKVLDKKEEVKNSDTGVNVSTIVILSLFVIIVGYVIIRKYKL